MMFAHLRRSVALWICPELRPIAGPIPVGFFNVDEARALAKARREWHGAERAKLAESAQLAGQPAQFIGERPVSVTCGSGNLIVSKDQRLGSATGDENFHRLDVAKDKSAEGLQCLTDGSVGVGAGGHESSLSGDEQTEPKADSAPAKRFLLELAEVLAAHQAVGLFAISMRALRKGDFFQNMKHKGTDCRTLTASKLFQWFSDNWPGDLEWPRHIPRPPKSKKEAA